MPANVPFGHVPGFMAVRLRSSAGLCLLIGGTFYAVMWRDRRCGVAENKAKDRQHEENFDDLH